MANTPNKFRGPSIRPVGGAGKGRSQSPNPQGDSKKQGTLLRDLENRKLELDSFGRLVVPGGSAEETVWGGDPYDPVLEPTESVGDRVILRYSKDDGEKIVIGCDDPSEMWFQCEDGKFRWVTRGGTASGPGIAEMVLNRSATNRPRLFVGVDSSGAITANTTLQIDGGIALGVATDTDVAPQVGDDDFLTLVDTSGGNATITLPAVASCLGRIYVFKKTAAANTLTIDGDAGETIDGAATQAVTNQYHLITVMAGPTEWHLLHIGAP